MQGAGEQAEVVAFLSDPRSYPGGTDRVDVIGTHISVIFLAGERAYKLKRAVKFSYLDYSTPQLRHAACQAELDLNRRTAPALYLEVQSIGRDLHGALQMGAGPPIVDWLVVMKRFPQEALFSHLAAQGGLTAALAAETADRIAAFHAGAEPTPAFGGSRGIAEVIEINDRNLRQTPPPEVTASMADELLSDSCTALKRLAARLDARQSAGKTRRCHGDLHLANICLVDGQPTLFDCIEFSPAIACIDVLYDLAFLLMDLDFRGLRHQASVIFNRYIDVADDDDGLPALPFFMSLRAAVRAHVTAAAAPTLDAEQQIARQDEAKRYFAFARSLLQPRAVRLVAVGGLSGTGKSTVAAGLAGELGPAPGARVLRSDVIRKQQFNLPPESRLPPAAYSAAASRKVYADLAARARAALAGGFSVIVDAVCAEPEERAALAEIARQAGVDFTGIWLDADPAVLTRRLVARTNDASDATPDVLHRQLAYDLGNMTWSRLDSGLPADAVIAAARRLLGLASA